jgi:catechol 2,3-dioxygenase
MSIMRLGYVHVRVTDLDDATRHYTKTLGLTQTAEVGRTRYFKGWDEFDHHSVVIEEGGVGLVKLGMKASSTDDLERFEKNLTAFGVTTSRMSKGTSLAVGEGLSVSLPMGQTLELYTDMEFLGTELGTLNPHATVRDPRGLTVPRLDHMLIAGEDPATTERMFKECLGFNVSERLIADVESNDLIATWLYAGQTSHDIALIKGEQGKLHHFAFWLEDWHQILRAGDVFSIDDTPVDYGPTRHGITRGLTVYFFDPAGNRNEVFTGSYRCYPDTPTVTWTMDTFPRALSSLQREVNESFLNVFT